MSEVHQSFEEADDIEIISRLATLLDLDISGVFDPETSIEEVERNSRLLEAQVSESDLQKVEAERQRQLRSLPHDIRAKLAAQLDEAAAALREG